jgi:hypothetical protein
LNPESGSRGRFPRALTKTRPDGGARASLRIPSTLPAKGPRLSPSTACKIKARKSRSNAGIKVGQVFVSSWGYDQTNVNYYEVVELVGKASVRARAIRGMACEGSEMESYGDRGYSMPSDDADRHFGEAFLAKVDGNCIKSSKIAGRDGASAWKGTPNYFSTYA